MGDPPTEKKAPKCPHCPHRLSDPSFRFHIEMLESTSEPASEPSKTSSTTSTGPSTNIKVSEEPTIEDIGTQNPKPNLDEPTISFKRGAKTPPPEYLHPEEESNSHPLHSDLEALLFGKETELVEPIPTSFPPHQQSDSVVQALTFIDGNGKVVNVIAGGEESDWSTSSAGMTHKEICPVCLGVVRRHNGEVKREGEEDEGVGDVVGDGEGTAPKQCSMRGGDMGNRKVCKGCGGSLQVKEGR
jgi:hypothetical protein